MLELKRVFQTHQQAMEVYRIQLSKQLLYVETFEGFPKGTEASVHLEIRETGKQIKLLGTVERLMGKKEAMETGFGQRPGLILKLPITPDVVEPLRAFFAAPTGVQSSVSRPSPVRSASQVVRPGQVVRPNQAAEQEAAMPETDEVPFATLSASDPQQASKLISEFLSLAESGSLYRLFNLRTNAERKQIRRVYNIVVRSLHPDAHEEGFSDELTEKLGDCYQVFNEAYQILSHPIRGAIYLDVSKANRVPNGMSLNAYKKWLDDYRMKSATSIRMADDLLQKAEEALSSGHREEAAHHIKLALQYDPYHEGARALKV